MYTVAKRSPQPGWLLEYKNLESILNKFLDIRTIAGAAITVLLVALIVLSSFSSLPATAQVPQPGEGLEGGPLVIYLAGEMDSTTPFIAPPLRARTQSVQAATINVTYTGSWSSQAQTAFQYAVDIWETQISSPVTIEVQANWTNLGGGGILGSAGSAGSRANFSGAPVANTWYPYALANMLAGTDLNSSSVDILVNLNSSYSSWYFGTDGQPPGNRIDMVSVALHELGHGLGFAGSMSASSSVCGSAGVGCWGYGSSYPFIYDRFTENGGGTALLSYPNYSTSLAGQLTGNEIYFDGPNARAANGGNRPELYAPSNWRQGSSYSHLGEVFNGTSHALMTYSIGGGEANHNPGSVMLGMFHDMGWALASAPPPTATSTASPSPTPSGPTPTPTQTPVLDQMEYLPVVPKDN